MAGIGSVHIWIYGRTVATGFSADGFLCPRLDGRGRTGIPACENAFYSKLLHVSLSEPRTGQADLIAIKVFYEGLRRRVCAIAEKPLFQFFKVELSRYTCHDMAVLVNKSRSRYGRSRFKFREIVARCSRPDTEADPILTHECRNLPLGLPIASEARMKVIPRA